MQPDLRETRPLAQPNAHVAGPGHAGAPATVISKPRARPAAGRTSRDLEDIDLERNRMLRPDAPGLRAARQSDAL